MRGRLKVPDPNTFGGEVEVKVGRGEWGKVPLVHGYRENSRGLGLADMAAGIEKGRPHRASGELAYHVVDVMQGMLEAASGGKAVDIGSTVERPAAMAVGGRDWEVE